MSDLRSETLHWIMAARLKTLPAAVIPVLTGSALAYHDQFFDLFPALIALLCAILIQIGTNFANDYYDFKKGTDNASRIGFERATASGRISPDSMLRATFITMGIAFLIGLLLVYHAGWIVLLIGILSLIFGIAYTGGPYPLGYNGLGDIFVFLFFGIVAVMTTYYVQALTWSPQTVWAALAIGALSTNILVVNNLRDSDTDKHSGKRTLGVIFGDTALKIEYSLLSALAIAIPPHYFFVENFTYWVLLPLISIPLMLRLNRQIWMVTDKRTLNDTLVQTAALLTLYGLLLSTGILLG